MKRLTLLFSLFAAALSHGAVNETISTVTINSGPYVIASDASREGLDRDKISVRVDFSYVSNSGGVESTDFRIDLQVREAGTNALVSTDQGIPFSVNAGTITTNDFRTRTITPTSTLVPWKNYYVRVGLFEQTTGSTYVLQDSLDTTAQQFLHFENTDNSDTEVNVLGEITSIDWDRRWALQTHTDPEKQKFKATANITLHRYDDYLETVPDEHLIGCKVTYELREEGSNNLIAVADDDANFGRNMDEFHYTGSVQEPYTREVIKEFTFKPTTQLASLSSTYYVRVSLSHEEVEDSSIYLDDQQNVSSSSEILHHFNGQLVGVNDGNSVNLIMDSLDNADDRVNDQIIGGKLFSIVTNPAGTIEGYPNYTFAATREYFVHLYDDGHAELEDLSFPIDITIPLQGLIGSVNLIRFTRSNMYFDGNGVHADISLILPAGLGVHNQSPENTQPKVYQSTLDAGTRLMTTTLTPTAANILFVHPSGAKYTLVEEIKPIAITSASILWDVAEGAIQPGGAITVQYIRDHEEQVLASSPLPAGDKFYRSNENYYKHVTGVTAQLPTPKIEPSTLGTAELSIELEIEAGDFHSHFPYDAELSWADPSVLAIENDLPVPTDSSLDNPGNLSVSFARDCADAAAMGCGAIGLATAKITPTADLAFTLDGGLSTGGDLVQLSSRRDVVMGYIDALSSSTVTYAHDSTIFANGRFLMAGHFISGKEQGLDLKNGPGRILSSGFSANDTSVDERPGTPEYLAGLADYPGMNYRVADEASVSAVSTIGGVTTPSYTLSNRAKYYTRLSGVSGIHEPSANPFTGPVQIYGYDFDFTAFGFSFLSSEVHESITAGSMDVPYPSEFTLAFDPLYLNCLGALTTAEIDGGTLEDDLDFWQAPFVASAAQFEPPAGGECDPSEAYLTLGVTAYASNFSTALAGKLGFKADGNLTTLQDSDNGTGPEGVDSRLSLTSNAYIDGPGDERYHFTPIADAYFDNFSLAENQSADVGLLNLHGQLDVSFFESPIVHVQTGAKPDNTTDLIYMLGGWTEAGIRTEDSADFDPNNRGRPASGTLANYRSATSADHQIHAVHDWLNVVDFDYALQWSTASRSFKSIAPKTNDLMVLTTENELTYLSAENAELDFGASLDLGIPEINLSSLAINAIDESTGVLEALTQSLAQEATDVLLEGLDAGESLLNDRLDELFDELFESAIDPVIEDFYHVLAAANGDPVAMQNAIDTFTNTNGPGTLYYALRNLTGSPGDSGSLADSVDHSLAQVQAAIRAVIGQVQFDNSSEVILGNPTLTVPEDTVIAAGSTAVEGLFARTDADGNGTPDELGYEIAKVLVIALLEELAPEIADNLSAVLNAAAGALLAEVEDELISALEEVAPSIEAVKETLMEIHNTIGDIREELTLFEALEDAFAASSAEIFILLDSVESVAEEFIETVDLTEYTEEEVKELLHIALRDQFDGSALIGEVRVILASYLYDLNASLNEGISSGFAQLNRMLTELVEDVMPVDSGLQNLLDDLASVGTAGKIDGYAHINGDALRTLRLDAEIELQLPDEFNIAGYFEINQLDSLGSDVCSYESDGEYAAEVKMGAVDIPARFLGGEPRFDIEGKFTFDTGSGFSLRGMGGSFEMTGGSLEFEAMEVTSLGAAAMFGIDENYMAAKVGLEFDSYQLAGGVFFGRTCSLEPLRLVDPDVENVLGDPPFTGIYAYGEAQIPIVSVGCLFSLSAKAGVGVFVFAEGPTVGGKMLVGASGRALCAVEVGGELTLIGAKVGNDFNFSGKGRVFGKVGVCPLCTEFNKSVTLTYKNDKWDYDY
ncbi:apolipoprotein A1/A4/E family protein [Roseibacillus persicicus]|uniref:Uncharacterized protein n=1 Tax=Roseibacillus persicicus TaxID=454148 RepID=A0A918WI57_9BACT|nr:apolipoprotein A1/A4/E family protein [Roseibacillus persicicus]GHC48608.1 hypothetical protein GCM10007100_13150 [Roseibacillus persicicus]